MIPNDYIDTDELEDIPACWDDQWYENDSLIDNEDEDAD